MRENGRKRKGEEEGKFGVKGGKEEGGDKWRDEEVGSDDKVREGYRKKM